MVRKVRFLVIFKSKSTLTGNQVKSFIEIEFKMLNLDHKPELKYIQQYKELNLDKKPISLLLLDATSKLRTILSNALNYEQLIPNDNNLHRDYRGLVIILKTPTTQQRSIQRSNDPALNIIYYLNSLCSSSSSKSFNQINNGHQSIIKQDDKVINQFCTIELLMHALEKLGRFDVIDDLLVELRSNPIDQTGKKYENFQYRMNLN